MRFGFSTIERWYYRALKERSDPVGVLRRKAARRCRPAASDERRGAPGVLAQYAAHTSWSVQLHHDNLVALAESEADLAAGAVLRDAAPLPQGATVSTSGGGSRHARRQAPTVPRRGCSIARCAATRPSTSDGLWHWDCHHGSRKVLTARGEWATPILFGVLDDRSRLACHLQWYLAETAEIVVHGLSQAFQKRGLPRAGLSDNGAAMTGRRDH